MMVLCGRMIGCNKFSSVFIRLPFRAVRNIVIVVSILYYNTNFLAALDLRIVTPLV